MRTPAVPSLDQMHTTFLAIVPRIELHARIYFRHVRCIHKLEDCVAETIGLAVMLGLGAAGPLDVGASPIVVPVEEQDSGPEIDRRLEVAGEVLIETCDQQLLDARVLAIGSGGIGRQ